MQHKGGNMKFKKLKRVLTHTELIYISTPEDSRAYWNSSDVPNDYDEREVTKIDIATGVKYGGEVFRKALEIDLK